MSKKDEIDCLNFVKNALNGDSFSEIVFNNSDIEEMKHIVFSAKQNEKATLFPDFAFDGGCIEHFEITSSKEDKKDGAQFRKEKRINDQEREKQITEQQKNFINSPFQPNTIVSTSYTSTYDRFSYDDFLLSFKKNVLKHLESLNKSIYLGKTNVLLIEQKTARMCVEKTKWWCRFYEIHKDLNILCWLKNNCKAIRYFIYKVSNTIEIIDFKRIDDLIKTGENYKNVEGGRLIDGTICVFADIQIK